LPEIAELAAGLTPVICCFVLGAQMGFLFGGLVDLGTADPTSHAIAFAVVGMAALFTAVVRAPLTGMILVTEMTANSRLVLPMLAACFSAMAVATMLREPPVYDSLKERTLVPVARSRRRSGT
jgi:chloride channel protein, CIC family